MRNCDLDLTEAESVKRRDAQVKQQADAAREAKRAAYERRVNERTFTRSKPLTNAQFDLTRAGIFTKRMAAWDEPGSVALLTEGWPCEGAGARRTRLLRRADELELTPLPTLEQWNKLVLEVAKLRDEARLVKRCKTCYNCRKWEV